MSKKNSIRFVVTINPSHQKLYDDLESIESRLRPERMRLYASMGLHGLSDKNVTGSGDHVVKIEDHNQKKTEADEDKKERAIQGSSPRGKEAKEINEALGAAMSSFSQD